MSNVEATLGSLSRASSFRPLPARPPAPAGSPAPRGPRVGTCSLRQIVGGAVADAEGEAIRRALAATLGNKSQAARLLRTNYTTLHAKMKRYGISAREFQA
ncbi:MAG TPA: helix-turn-helix domain-containing protein [Methylomirabilota bacterium]|nr:helix-turn-helix domain-containing protein [Methylomirabilota bacterium]